MAVRDRVVLQLSEETGCTVAAFDQVVGDQLHAVPVVEADRRNLEAVAGVVEDDVRITVPVQVLEHREHLLPLRIAVRTETDERERVDSPDVQKTAVILPVQQQNLIAPFRRGRYEPVQQPQRVA